MRKKIYRWCRHQRTTQEKRFSVDEDHAPYVRAKRNKANLPDAWNDDWKIRTRSWKDKRRTQYREAGEKAVKHTLTLPANEWWDFYDWVQYLEEYDIPHRVTKKREKYTVTRIKTHDIRWEWDKTGTYFNRREIPLDKPIVKVYNCYRVIERTVVWWTKK